MKLHTKSTPVQNDLGFGTIPVSKNQRMMHRNGSANVRRTGLPLIRTADMYNALIKMSTGKFIFIVLQGFLVINLFFATVYVLLGTKNLEGLHGATPFTRFLDAFFFSAQTISTVGYGHIFPTGIATSFVAAFESMMGLMVFALATGLLYGRFSRPSAKILYSEKMLLAPYKNGKAFMFRFANLRSNQLVELEVTVTFTYNEEVNGKKVRRFHPLKLERNKVNLLTTSWTIVHPLNEESPINDISKDNMKNGDAEFIVMIKAFDDTFSQTVHSRTSYPDENIVWGAKFLPPFQLENDGVLNIDLRKLHHFESYIFE